jgi:hypothetical protein
MASTARWLAYGIVALAFGPIWYELVAQLYSGVFSGMPPSTLFSLQQRHPEVLAACSLASLAVALPLRRRIGRARGIDLAFLSGGFLLAGAVLVPPLWWLIVMARDLVLSGSGPSADDALVATLYTPALLALSGLAWTVLIVWAAWPLAAIELWLLRGLVRPAASPSARPLGRTP